MHLPLLQIVALFLYSLAILFDDFRGGILQRLDISTTFAIMIFLSSFSHFSALSDWFDPTKSWATYLVKATLEDGLFVFNIGSCVIMESLRRSIKHPVFFTFPYRNPQLFTITLVISLIVFASSHFRILPRLGSVTSFIALLVNGSVFLLSFIAHTTNSRLRIYIVVGYVMLLSLYAIQFSYLRMEIIVPWLAYFLGEILARKRVLDMHALSKIVFAAGLIIFPVIFTYLGKNRNDLRGNREKLGIVLKESVRKNASADGETLLDRLNVLGQMSNVVNLTQKKGFYNGFTLRYFSFVFVPRILWPDKPQLDGGQWFAVEIGRSYYQPSGKAANSINMTVPGEMFLNFAWIGLLIGCVLFGYFIGFIWKLVSGEDLFSWAFRFYLLFLGMFSLGSDLMIIPQLIAYLLIYKTVLFLRSYLYA